MIIIKIIETSRYKRDLKKLQNKKFIHELNRLKNIISLIINEKNLKDLINNNISKIYYIEKKSANLKEYYTARLNSKIRLIMKPIGEYPYNLIEIVEIEFIEINDNHYGDG